MNSSSSVEIETWESEGGAVPVPLASSAPSMTGTTSQVEWAERIRQGVIADFDRVAAAFRMVAVKQDAAARADTEAVITILEDKRAETLSRRDAGYYIHDWQEITDQVRQMIFRDNRYRTIKKNRAAR